MANEHIYIDLNALSIIKNRIISEINANSSLTNFDAGACGDSLLNHLKQTKFPSNMTDSTKVIAGISFYNDITDTTTGLVSTLDITTMTIGNTDSDIVGPIPTEYIK